MAKQTKKAAAPVQKQAQVAKKPTTYTEVDGDVIEYFFKSGTDAAILHGANCQKVMGAGIADQIREKLQPLFYLDQYDTRSAFQRLGSYSAVVVGKVQDKVKIGVNLYSQFLPGPSFDMNAFINAMKAFKLSIPPEQRGNLTLYMPKIGCGIGGAKWEDVEPAIRRELADFNVVLVNYVPREEEVPVTETSSAKQDTSKTGEEKA